MGPIGTRAASRVGLALVTAVLCLCAIAIALPGSAQNAIVLVGAGDIADCASRGDEETARLLDRIPGTVFTIGDNAYPRGTIREFAECFEPSWGRHRARIRPAAGNHDYYTRGATGYFTYFGAAAGPPDKGYYSYDLRAWHIVVLNSNCGFVACGPESLQAQWLWDDLAKNPRRCTLAYWHHPRFSSGPHGNDRTVDTFWRILFAAGAEVVVNGHDHFYERFAPQTPTGLADGLSGIQQFTVGTGGSSLYRVRQIRPNSVVRDSSTFGVIKLTLRSNDYSWQFVGVGGRGVKDAGTRSCH